MMMGVGEELLHKGGRGEEMDKCNEVQKGVTYFANRNK